MQPGEGVPLLGLCLLAPSGWSRAGGWGNMERQWKSQHLNCHCGFSADQQSAMCDFSKQKETWMGVI